MKEILFVALSVALLLTQKAFAQNAEEVFQKGVQYEEVKGELDKAIDEYKLVIEYHSPDRQMTARALLHLGNCYEKLGKSQAKEAYEQIIHQFADQSAAVQEARKRLLALGQTPPPGSVQMTTQRIWVGPDVDFLGNISPDGSFFAYTEWDSTGNLLIRNLLTGTTHQLTNKGNWVRSAEFAECPVFSPDGKQIAYSWYSKEDKLDLRTMNRDGSGMHILIHDLTDLTPGAWMPEGKHIIVTMNDRKDGTGSIAIVSTETGNLEILKTLPSPFVNMDYKISISQDGLYAVFANAQEKGKSNKDIYLLSLNNKQLVPIVQNPSNDYSPIWTQDAKNILFISDRAGLPGLWRQQMNKDNPVGAPVLVKSDIGKSWLIGLAKNGSLCYATNTSANNVYTCKLDLENGSIESTPQVLSSSYIGSNSSPAWSPDGKSIAYISDRGTAGGKVLIIRSLASVDEKEYKLELELRQLWMSIRWSPVGHSICFIGSDKNGPGVFRMDLATSKMIRVTSKGSYAGTPSISPDGNTLYYMRFDGMTAGIYAFDLQSDKENKIYTYGRLGIAAGLSLSPDGKQIAFGQHDDSLKQTVRIMSVSGGDAQVVFQADDPRYLVFGTDPVWTPDGKSLLFVLGGPDSASRNKYLTDLMEVSIKGGKPQKLNLNTKDLFSQIRLGPDGKQLAFTTGNSNGEIWVMENFLPKEDNTQ